MSIIDFFYKTPDGSVGQSEGAGVQMGRVMFVVLGLGIAITILVAVL